MFESMKFQQFFNQRKNFLRLPQCCVNVQSRPHAEWWVHSLTVGVRCVVGCCFTAGWQWLDMPAGGLIITLDPSFLPGRSTQSFPQRILTFTKTPKSKRESPQRNKQVVISKPFRQKRNRHKNSLYNWFSECNKPRDKILRQNCLFQSLSLMIHFWQHHQPQTLARSPLLTPTTSETKFKYLSLLCVQKDEYEMRKCSFDVFKCVSHRVASHRVSFMNIAEISNGFTNAFGS